MTELERIDKELAECEAALVELNVRIEGPATRLAEIRQALRVADALERVKLEAEAAEIKKIPGIGKPPQEWAGIQARITQLNLTRTAVLERANGYAVRIGATQRNLTAIDAEVVAMQARLSTLVDRRATVATNLVKEQVARLALVGDIDKRKADAKARQVELRKRAA